MQTNDAGMCPHCGMGHTGSCPRIKAIEYYPNGTVKRVEYHELKPVIVGRPDPTLPPGWDGIASGRYPVE